MLDMKFLELSFQLIQSFLANSSGDHFSLAPKFNVTSPWLTGVDVTASWLTEEKVTALWFTGVKITAPLLWEVEAFAFWLAGA